MVKIRPLVENDIPAVVELRRKMVPHACCPSAADLGAHVKEMFLTGPWCDEGLASLVYEDQAGRVVGFLGVMPRSMLFHGEPIRVAVLTLLMVDPTSRGGVGPKLLQACFRGPQDLSLADWANDVGRHVWEKAGGRTALLYSLYWTRPLRPWRFAAAGIGGGIVQRLMRAAVSPLLAMGDAAAVRLSDSWFRLSPPPVAGTDLSIRGMVEHWHSMMRDHSLVAEIDERMLDYVLHELARKRELGVLQRVLVRDGTGAVIGWYVYYVNVGEIGQVVHVAALPGKYGEIFDHMFYDAWRRGVLALQGRLEPQLLVELEARRCVIRHNGPWTVVHSAKPEVLAVIDRGDAAISRLDGEFWMVF